MFQLCGAREGLSFGGKVLTIFYFKKILFNFIHGKKILYLKASPCKVSDLILLDIRVASRHGIWIIANLGSVKEIAILNHMHIPKCLIRLVFFVL